MFTGVWLEQQQPGFLRLIGASSEVEANHLSSLTALFLDPDTGINEKGGKQHVSFDRLALEASRYALVFSFDQSFSRKAKPLEIMRSKLAALQDRGCHAMYYNSHARFLFVTTRKPPLHELRAHLISLGLPQERLLESGT
jgi:hypothetical protein